MKKVFPAIVFCFLTGISAAQTADETKAWITSKLNVYLNVEWMQGGCTSNPQPYTAIVSQIKDHFLTVTYTKTWNGTNYGTTCRVNTSAYTSSDMSEIKDSYSFRIDLTKIDSLTLVYSKFLKTSGSSTMYIKGNTYCYSKLAGSFTWEKDGYEESWKITINEGTEPDLAGRLWKAIKHYLKVMPPKKTDELF